jgi:hypothetical protein
VAEVSVDTYLKGKKTTGYRTLRRGGVKIHLSPKLLEWGRHIHIDVKHRVMRRADFDIEFEHVHGPNCRH